MHWITVNNDHINVANITTVKWEGGTLYIWFIGEETPAKWEDPDRTLYRALCRDLCINAVPEG